MYSGEVCIWSVGNVINVGSTWSVVLFTFAVSLLLFCLGVLSVIESGLLESLMLCCCVFLRSDQCLLYRFKPSGPSGAECIDARHCNIRPVD